MEELSAATARKSEDTEGELSGTEERSCGTLSPEVRTAQADPRRDQKSGSTRGSHSGCAGCGRSARVHGSHGGAGRDRGRCREASQETKECGVSEENESELSQCRAPFFEADHTGDACFENDHTWVVKNPFCTNHEFSDACCVQSSYGRREDSLSGAESLGRQTSKQIQIHLQE